MSKIEAAELYKLKTPPAMTAAVASVYDNVNDKVVENGSKKTDWDIPLGIVNETIWELKAPKFVPLFAVKKVVVAGSTTWVIPSGVTLTEYALAESGKLGGKSYFKLGGNPI